MRLAALLLVTLALSGCFGQDDPPAGEDDPDDPDDHDDGQDNQTVVRTLNLDTNVTTGEAPLDVMFDFNATGTNRATSWILDLPGRDVEGISIDLPGQATYRFNVGEFHVNFTVDYGDGEVLTETVTINATSPPVEERPDPIRRTFTGTAEFGVPQLGGAELASAREADLNGTFVAYYGIDVPEGAARLNVELTGTGAQADFDLFVEDPGGEFTSSGNTGSEEATSQGNLVTGTYWVYAYLYAGAQAEAEVTITVTF